MPSTPDLLRHLLIGALKHSSAFNGEHDVLVPTLEEISTRLGFEITLNSLWQTCRQAIKLLFESFAALEADCLPNQVHAFLAYWLSTGGTVMTTNYDRLIERAWGKAHVPIQTRYREECALISFENWQEDLARGGCLFKLHGSLDDPESCLGALEHVGTQLIGYKEEVLTEIVQTRPLCFVGWRGVDPDIPPLLFNTLGQRDSLLPTFWLHYEGKRPGSISLEAAIHGTSPLIRPYASHKPILTDADRAFGEMLNWVGIRTHPNSECEAATFDFSDIVNQCSRSGMARMVGSALRRADQLDSAMRVIAEAIRLAGTAEERSAAIQAMARVQQLKVGDNADQARRLLVKASETLGDRADPWQQLNADFGLLSMTIDTLKTRPWLIFKVPSLFREYGQNIDTFRSQTSDKESAALHMALFYLYLGKLRLKLFGWLATLVYPLAQWILEPFNIARSTIGDAKNIHLDSRVTVFAYRAVALAYLRRCQEAIEDVPEIERLITILNDISYTKHWENQKREIELRCDLDLKTEKPPEI